MIDILVNKLSLSFPSKGQHLYTFFKEQRDLSDLAL